MHTYAHMWTNFSSAYIRPHERYITSDSNDCLSLLLISENCDGILVGFIALVFVASGHIFTHTRTHTNTSCNLTNFWDRYALIMQPFSIYLDKSEFMQIFGQILFNEMNPFRHTSSWSSIVVDEWMDAMHVTFSVFFPNTIQAQLKGEIFHVIFI